MRIGEQIDRVSDFVDGRASVLIRAVVVSGLILLTAAVLLVLAELFAPAIGKVSDNALYWSVGTEAGGNRALGSDGCDHRRGRVWHCDVDDPGASDEVGYRVVLHGDCWRALRVTSPGFEGPMARRPPGCVRLRDQVRLFDRLFS